MTAASIPIRELKDTKAFEKIKVGDVELSHRVVFPPTTRIRALDDNTPSNLQLQYYDERSKYPGSLLIMEGTLPTPLAGLYKNVPGIFTEEHVRGWKKINEKIHGNGSYSSIQFWGLGRVADPAFTKESGYKLPGPSELYHDDDAKAAAEKAGNPIHAFTEEEIHKLIYEEYTKAAKNAIEAGFDFIELHSAHGYLLDTFLQSATNHRTDKYGGSIENRARFSLELIDHLSKVVGAEKLAIRLSPWAKFQNMKAELDDVHPVAQIGYLLGQLEKRGREGKRLAYVSVVEPRASGIHTVAKEDQVGDNTFVRTIWKGILLRAGNYTYDAPEFKTLLKDLSDDKTLVGISRYYISNPDLIFRLHDGLALTPYNRDLFYTVGDYGYNSYAKHGEEPIDKDTSDKKELKRID